MSTSDYIPTIGIETHVQLKTKTKLFSAVSNDARTAPPNSLISHIDIGLPGALPVLNQKALELAARAAFALNTKPERFSKFDRKHYFYPDLPKGYQITQYEDPIIKNGYVEFTSDGQTQKAGITRIHLEEDAGKNIHPAGADYTLVDLNRAGTPLLEIVSQPDIHSAVAAKAYARELWLIMKYAGATDGDLYHGHMRFDINTSVSIDPAKPGTRTEIKNLNSFRAVEAAVEYEIKRQTELLEKGQPVIQETRGWDEAKQKTTAQRGKEEAQDYRYMPEPDIPPLELDEQLVNKIKSDMPPLPGQVRQILNKLSISAKVVEDILDLPPEIVAKIIDVAGSAGPTTARRLAFWALETGEIDTVRDVELANMLEAGHINSTAAKAIRANMATSEQSPQQIAKKLNVIQVSDEAEIEKIVADVITENPQAARDIKTGQPKAIGFLVGQAMVKSKGQANPQLAQKLIKKQLGI